MTLSTRAQIRQEALRRTGGFVETSTTDSTTTTGAVTMIGRGGGDDVWGNGMGVYDPTDAAADKFRIADSYVDLTGVFTHGAITDRDGGETIEFYPRNDPTPYDFDDAINRTLSETKRIVETVIPTVESTREYSLFNMPWITKNDDIVSVLFRRSNNVVDNSQFELWGRGADAQLHAWVLSGANATVTRVDGLNQRFSARMTAAGGGGAVLTQTIPIPITQLYGLEFTAFGRIKSATPATASIDIFDGTDTTQSSQHDGGSDWDEFTVTHTVNADAVGPLQIKLTLDATDGNADFENVVMVEDDSVVEWLQDYGDQSASASHVRWSMQPRSSLPVLVTDRKFDRKSQLVVQSLQRYFELTADSGTGGVTDMPFEAAVAGTIVKLAERQAGRPNAARWAAYEALYLPKYRAWQRSLSEPSKRPTPRRVEVRGA